MRGYADMWKNPVERVTYPRPLCRGIYGHFVGSDHGHFVGQAYRFIPIDSPIVGRARLWKAKTAFTQDAGPGYGSHGNLPAKAKPKPAARARGYDRGSGERGRLSGLRPGHV